MNNAIEIYVPYPKRVIEDAPTVRLGTEKCGASHTTYCDLLADERWDTLVSQLATRFVVSDGVFLQSPHVMQLLECEVVERIQRFIIFCDNAGYGRIPGWKLVVENIRDTMFGFQFIFHYSAE